MSDGRFDHGKLTGESEIFKGWLIEIGDQNVDAQLCEFLGKKNSFAGRWA